MKKLTRILFIVACLCLPIALQAQKKDDSRYLTGAVPEENGKVVFSKHSASPACRRMLFSTVSCNGWMPA